jgi:hypothetical protein
VRALRVRVARAVRVVRGKDDEGKGGKGKCWGYSIISLTGTVGT